MNTPTVVDDRAKRVYVLVEEENAIREEWERIAKLKGLELISYAYPEGFLSDFKSGGLKGTEDFYLDQDMCGVRGVGVGLAGAIKRRWPQAATYLVTAYPKALFHRELREGVVNDVFGKYPSPFDNPAFTEFERRYEREVWIPMLSALGGCH